MSEIERAMRAQRDQRNHDQRRRDEAVQLGHQRLTEYVHVLQRAGVPATAMFRRTSERQPPTMGQKMKYGTLSGKGVTNDETVYTRVDSAWYLESTGDSDERVAYHLYYLPARGVYRAHLLDAPKPGRTVRRKTGFGRFSVTAPNDIGTYVDHRGRIAIVDESYSFSDQAVASYRLDHGIGGQSPVEKLASLASALISRNGQAPTY